MDEYSVVDRRKCRFIIMDKSVPLAYMPYIGSQAVCVYLIYASLADQGNLYIDSDALKEFMSIDDQSLEECNKALEEYGLIKLESHEHNGKIANFCYVLQPPPFPRTLYVDLRKKSLVKDAIDDILQLTPGESKVQPVRARTPLITPAKLITKFYSLIGNGKVDIFEREAGKKHIGDLTKRGYSLEDIDFAIEWGFENSRNEMEDLSSISTLIDRAIRAKEDHLASLSNQAEEQAMVQGNEEIERKMIESYRKMMSDSERKSLRERALDLIKQDKRIKEEFITEQFIIIKENQIIREEYLKVNSQK